MIELDMFNLIPYDTTNIDHRVALINLANDSEVQKYMGNLLSVFNTDNGNYYMVESRGIIVGIVYLQLLNGLNEVSYAVMPNMRNSSIGSELLREYSNYLFNNGIDSIYLQINDKNIGSIKVATNVGFVKDGRTRYFKGKTLTK